MKRELAIRLLGAARALDRELGDVDDVISQIDNEDEQEEYRQVLATLIDTIAAKLIFRIFREHPELDDEK